ncbi:hypothetical protein BS47DRAFT_1322553 [Hydnum rufescens UP504]|uniref:Aminoglycoside phosphotransferase domain-containing protein n=1 Tax=Hydnum rufescens UP504 TaxID=1448309 RepID=A0A9P6AFE9_9AGAM|nr:hypothetical protein BS47DRAFT_1322553 [Hydnum rufescens UP504]
MPFYKCDATHCREPSVRGEGVCFLCNSHYCAAHMKSGVHTCTKLAEEEYAVASARASENEINALLSEIRVDVLRARAMSLRNGISCDIPPLDYNPATALMGGMNYHFPITFQDGVTWLCRIRRHNASSPPMELRDRILLSEAATLRFLANTRIPVPKVYDFAISSPNNPVGVGYILMEKLDGKPLPPWSTIDVDRRKHVLAQFVEVFAELEKHPLPAIGSLRHPEDQSIGPLTIEQFADADEDGHAKSLGPFSTATEYRYETVRRQMELVSRGEVHHTNAVDSYLVHRYLLECVPWFARQEEGSGSAYYLKHMDDKGDHILVDDDFNITGIVDWEWAQTAPKSEAFAAPMFLLDVGSYYDGKNELSEGEELFASMLEGKGHRELAQFVRRGRVEHRWASCLGGDAGFSDSLRAMFSGLRGSLRRDRDWDGWRKRSLKKYANDKGLKLLTMKHTII